MSPNVENVAELMGNLPGPLPLRRNPRLMIGLIVAVSVAGFGFGEVVIAKRGQTLLEAARHRAEVVVESRAQLAEGWKARWRDATAPLRSNPAIRLFAERTAGGGTGASAQDDDALVPYLQAALDDFFRRRPEVASARLLDGQGRAFLATSGAQAPSDSMRDQARRVFIDGEEHFGGLVDAADGLLLDVFLPLRPVQAKNETEAKRPVAVLAVSVRAAGPLNEILAPGYTLEPDERVALVQDGPSGAEAAFFGQAALSAAPAGGPPAVRTFERGETADAAPAYLLAQEISGTPWRLLYVRDAAALDGERMDVRIVVDLLVLALAVLLSAGIVFLWWRQSLLASRQLTEQYRAFSRRLDVRHRLLQLINDTIVEDIHVVDAGRRIVYANGSFGRWVGRAPQECVGQSIDSLLTPKLAKTLAGWDAELLKGGEPVTGLLLDPDRAEPRWLDVSKSAFGGSGDRGVGIVTVTRDVTEAQMERERQQTLMRNTIRVLTSSVAAADPYLADHAGRLEDVAVGIAEVLQVPPDDVVTLRTAAALSQIGKIFLPHNLMRSESRLSREARRQMERHIDFALEAIKGIAFDRPVPETLAEMHERLDGSGYPRQLKGAQISLLGRIMGVSDVFAARIAPRSYRHAAKVEDVIDIFRNNREKYDSAVVDALERYLASRPESAA